MQSAHGISNLCVEEFSTFLEGEVWADTQCTGLSGNKCRGELVAVKSVLAAGLEEIVGLWLEVESGMDVLVDASE